MSGEIGPTRGILELPWGGRGVSSINAHSGEHSRAFAPGPT